MGKVCLSLYSYGKICLILIEGKMKIMGLVQMLGHSGNNLSNKLRDVGKLYRREVAIVCQLI